MQKKIVRLLPKDVVFMECDIQEKMRKLILNFDSLAHNAQRMTKVAKLLDIPVISTSQLPRVFGETISELVALYDKPELIFRHSKTDFSMLEKPVWGKLQSLNRQKIVLYGMEAHVCIKQTCLDLLDRNFDVTLVVDTISSMNYHDRTVGIEAMRDAGAHITTFQCLVFELARNPGIPQYKELLSVIKDMPQEHIQLHHQAKL